MKWLLIILVSVLCLSANASDIELSDFNGGSQELVNFRKVDEGEILSFKLQYKQQEIFAKNIPQGASLTSIEDDSWIFNWEPTDTQSGEYSLGFYTQDPNDFIYKNIRIIVSNTKFMITAEEEFSYLFTATDPDNDNVELTMTNIPNGASFTGSKFNPKIFSWTPSIEQVGIHIMTLIATDNPIGGTPKQDVSTIEINVSLLSKTSMLFDFNRDGKINMFDYSIFSKHWLKGSPKDITPPTPIAPIAPIAPAESELLSVIIVYKTELGTEYHKIDCIYLTNSFIQSSIGECIDLELEPCNYCKPNDINYTSYTKKSITDILRDLVN